MVQVVQDQESDDLQNKPGRVALIGSTDGLGHHRVDDLLVTVMPIKGHRTVIRFIEVKTVRFNVCISSPGNPRPCFPETPISPWPLVLRILNNNLTQQVDTLQQDLKSKYRSHQMKKIENVSNLQSSQ